MKFEKSKIEYLLKTSRKTNKSSKKIKTQIFIRFLKSTYTGSWKTQRYIFKVLNEKNIEHRILYPAKLSFTYKSAFKIYLGICGFRRFVTQNPILITLMKDHSNKKRIKYRKVLQEKFNERMIKFLSKLIV